MSIIAVGIDRGFGVTKYYSDLKKGSFQSLIAPLTKEKAKTIIENNADDEETMVVKYLDKYYLVGKKVARLFINYGERSLERNRKSIPETVLFLTGLALATDKEEEPEVLITTGLPTDDFEKYHKEYEAHIKNDGKAHELVLYKNKKSYNKKIRVREAYAENQPKGTIISTINDKFSRGLEWDEIKDIDFAVCDIGYNTTDLSVYAGKDLVTADSINFSTKAMVHIVNTARTLIYEKYNSDKKEDEILDALKSGTIKVRGKKIDCSEEVKNAFVLNADEIVDEVISKWEGMIDSFDEIIVTGGAVENNFFANVLKDMFKDKSGWIVTIPETPQLANVFGFYLIAQSVLQNKKNNS
jgi:hypothetical protein